MLERLEQFESLMREARQSEEGLRREEIDLRTEGMASTAAFNNAFLSLLGQLVQAISKKKGHRV